MVKTAYIRHEDNARVLFRAILLIAKTLPAAVFGRLKPPAGYPQ